MDKVNYGELLAEKPDRRNAQKPYQSPQLIAYGDIRDITLGGSPGLGDSAGDPARTQNPT